METPTNRPNDEPEQQAEQERLFFERMESSISDPRVQLTLEKAKERQRYYEEIVAAGADQIELELYRQSTVDELDNEWFYANESVTLTGPGLVKEKNVNKLYTKTFMDEDVVSNGFGFVPDYDYETGEYKGHTLMLVFRKRINKKTFLIGASLDDIRLRSDKISLEYATSILKVSYPDIYNAIEDAYDEAGESDASKIAAMRGVCIVDHRDNGEEENTLRRRAAEIYLSDRLQLETELPYRFVADGPYVEVVWGQRPEARETRQEQHGIAIVQAIKFLPVDCSAEYQIPGSTVLQPSLEVAHYSQKRNDQPTLRYYPFSSVKDLASLRTLAGNYEDY